MIHSVYQGKAGERGRIKGFLVGKEGGEEEWCVWIEW